eukprot:TRINITY_DN2825_c0_g2_i1.p1 TRINITY_DN2825_c0_g2~~TRINITY_DN2825_c0_g2_i1.p1  ORF type:complete len:159 (+),score=13.34 TRINITY_DN2825_c0_g2_i1:183-659(+)
MESLQIQNRVDVFFLKPMPEKPWRRALSLLSKDYPIEPRGFVVTRKRKLVPTAGGMDSVVDFPVPELHIVHKFLLEWFEMKPLEDGFRMCSFERCGRPETRRHEFRRCSVCGTVNYCSRCCQALHWRTRHRFDCPRQHQAPQNHAEQEAVAFAPEEGH